MLSYGSAVLRTSPPPSAIWFNPVRASQVHAQPLPCTPSHLTPDSLIGAYYRFFPISLRFHPLRKVDHYHIVYRCLTGFIYITAYMIARCELSTICFRLVPHNYFRLNDKVVYVILSYYWVFN